MRATPAASYLFRGRFAWRTNLVLIPGAIVLTALLIFFLTQAIDHAEFNGSIRLPHWVNQGGASDCRDLVSATAGAIITTLGLVLSITVLIFSTAATQFGQRLLRRYMRDRGTQVSIGIFAATFVFSLLTLLSVTSRPDEREFVPWVSAWTSLILAISCVGILIYFMHHVAVLIQVNTVLRNIRDDVSRVIDTLRSPRKLPLSVVAGIPPSHGLALTAPESGYFQRIYHDELAEAARAANVVIDFLIHPGHFSLEGSEIALAKPGPGLSTLTELPPALVSAFNDTVIFGLRRTMRQDPKFAILQIVEIGLRAMSPAVNDPFTMITCIDTLAASLKAFLDALPLYCVHADSQGVPRIIEPAETFEKLADAGFAPIRQVCCKSVATTYRIFEAIGSLAPFIQSLGQADNLDRQADLTKEGFSTEVVSQDAADIQSAYASAKAALASARQRLAKSN
jgi:uncharacterized membrane protein